MKANVLKWSLGVFFFLYHTATALQAGIKVVLTIPSLQDFSGKTKNAYQDSHLALLNTHIPEMLLHTC